MSEKTSNRYIPLIQTVREIDRMSQVWFEGSGGVVLPVKEGDVVTIRGRVFEVKRAGGYVRGSDFDRTVDQDQAIKRRDAFALDLGEIYLNLSIRDESR